MNDKKNKKLLKTLDRVCKECEGVGQGKPFFGPVYQDDPVAEKNYWDRFIDCWWCDGTGRICAWCHSSHALCECGEKIKTR